MSPFLPIGEVCQVANIMLQSIRSMGDSARNHKEAIPKIQLLEATVKQLINVQVREQDKLRNRKHHAEHANALQSLQNLCAQLDQQIHKAKKITHKKGFKLKLYNIRSAIFGVCDLAHVASMMETLITSWLKLQNLPAEVREALQKNVGSLPVYLEVQSDHGYMPLAKVEYIRELLQNSENKVLLVHGMSGIGKSSLARFVAAQPPERFTDGALELLFGQACSIAGSDNDPLEYHKLLTAKLSAILRKLGCKKEQLEGLTLDNACLLLQEVLTGKNYLIVLDDVWEVDITTRFTRLSGNNCKILVTTRNESVHSIAEADKMEIRERDVKEVGKAILMYHTQLTKLPELWEELLQRCGYHPLTISVIGEALSGETRHEEWEKAIHNLSMYAAKATVPVTYQTAFDSASSTIFGSFEFSLRALPQDARDLFQSFALFLWTEPIPEICLEKIWAALKPHSLFRLEVGKLVKGSLIAKPDYNFCYRMHGMVSLFLDDELLDATKMLQFKELSADHAGLTWAIAAAWIFRYGKSEPKKAAANYLTAALRSGIYVLQVTVLHSVVELLDFVSSLTEVSITSEISITSEKFKNILDGEIIYLISCGNVHPHTASAIAHYIGNVYGPKDYKLHANDFINAGAIQVLSSLFQGSEPGQVTESMYEALSVVYELVKIGDASSTEALLHDPPVKELVGLYFVGLAMDTLERLCELGGEAIVEEIFEAGLWEKLAGDCKDQLGLMWPRRERSIIKDRFLRLLSDRSQKEEDEDWSVSKSMEQESFQELQMALGKASDDLLHIDSCIYKGEEEVKAHIEGEEHSCIASPEEAALDALSEVRATLKSMRGAPAKAWEEIIRSTDVAGRVLQMVCPYTPKNVRQSATECLCELNYHPSSISVLEEVLTGQALDTLMCSVASPNVEEDVSCKLFEVLESLLNRSMRQDEIIEKGGVDMLFKLIMSQGEWRPKLQEKVLFYVVFSPLHVKKDTRAWIEHLLEEGVVETLALFPTINHNSSLPVLPFWFLCKFGTSITKTDRLQTSDQTRLTADFMWRMKSALPQFCNGVSGEDITSIESLLKV
ncbi:hypothetical protein GOP47_0006205 [Adiantum capillus-veneris]|uniref:NB-ARC domain-containing protein n=1 Tax=Adiantum capillus-veneris TaxID=13818 RepID=A0A9D4ZK65_ADICA|nr:hypothetical protein GOP47_0006205 [Adiantum capillus-veneris]